MEGEEKPPDATPAELAAARPEAVTPGERLTFESKIEEQEETIAALRAEIAELKRPAPRPKRQPVEADAWIPTPQLFE